MAQTSPPLKIGANTFVGYGLLYLAQEKGFFKQQGVDVQIVNTEDKPSTAAALASGRLDGWVTTVDTFIFYDAKKLGIKQSLVPRRHYRIIGQPGRAGGQNHPRRDRGAVPHYRRA